MASYTSVWVHAANVAEVNNQQGFVEVTTELAAELIAAEKAQDPQVGGLDLIELEDVTATSPKKRGRQPKPDSGLLNIPEPVVETPAPTPPVVENKQMVADAPKKVYLTK